MNCMSCIKHSSGSSSFPPLGLGSMRNLAQMAATVTGLLVNLHVNGGSLGALRGCNQ